MLLVGKQPTHFLSIVLHYSLSKGVSFFLWGESFFLNQASILFSNAATRKMLFAAILSICTLSSKKILIYNEEIIVAPSSLGFIRKSLGKTCMQRKARQERLFRKNRSPFLGLVRRICFLAPLLRYALRTLLLFTLRKSLFICTFSGTGYSFLNP
jgi:Mitochondrial ATP synthase B chain precursor (ATP-synt_B)